MSKFEHKWNFVLPRIREDFARAGAGIDFAAPSLKVLEYGCGTGETSLRLAHDYPQATVVGVDIRDMDFTLFDKAATLRGTAAPPANLSYVNMARPPEGTLIARPGEIDMGHIPDAGYDLCLSWCVFEHIDTQIMTDTLKRLHGLIRPGGWLYLMINPLYFSEYGSHLNSVLPEPWLHLTLDIASLRERFFAAPGPQTGRAFMWAQFETLNRLTADHLNLLVEQAGFDPVWEDRKTSGKPGPSLLATYNDAVLRTKEVTIIARR